MRADKTDDSSPASISLAAAAHHDDSQHAIEMPSSPIPRLRPGSQQAYGEALALKWTLRQDSSRAGRMLSNFSVDTMLKYKCEINGTCDLDFAESNHALEGECRIVVNGSNNRIRIAGQRRMSRLTIAIHGDGHEIDIDEDNRIGRVDIRSNHYNSKITMARGSNIRGLLLANGEGAATIAFGSGILVSTDVVIKTHDSHPIYDEETNRRINAPRDITIMDRVWFCEQVKVLKGVRIGSDTVIGVGSIVTGEIPPNSVAAGVPARVVRSGTRWQFSETGESW